jgi:hypothetical protein
VTLSRCFATALLGWASGACSAVLDFDDECGVAADCISFGRGLTCEDGFCVAQPLVEEASCERDSDCSTYGTNLS